jgi:hypothetical protein
MKNYVLAKTKFKKIEWLERENRRLESWSVRAASFLPSHLTQHHLPIHLCLSLSFPLSPRIKRLAPRPRRRLWDERHRPSASPLPLPPAANSSMAAESCGSRGASPPPPPSSAGGGGAAGRRRKAEAYAEVLHRIRAGGYGNAQPRLDDELWAHFQGLPARSFSLSPGS